VLLRLLPLAGAPVEFAEAEVAVGDERAHAELLTHDAGLTVVSGGLADAQGITTPGDLTEQTQRMRLSEECGLESRAGSERWAFWHAVRDDSRQTTA
jgi:hypothetical protein